ncbi:MAG: M56 family metallopeptidase [Lachnospiraceae bacterium]|nr:M56 family metallopeptidase [Lachnospiraceae bacterium]
MEWTTEFLCGLIMTTFCGSVMLAVWYGIGCFLDRVGCVNILYRFLQINILFFAVPLPFWFWQYMDREKGMFGGWLFSRTPYVSEVSFILFFIWLVGAAVMAIWMGFSAREAHRKCRMTVPEKTERQKRFRQVCGEMAIRRERIRLAYSGAADTPFIIGLLRPRVVLPPDDCGEEEERVIFVHELVHYKQKDLWFKWLVLLLLCVQWFNPAVWCLSSTLKKWSEYACDYQACRYIGDEKYYASVLVKSIRKKRHWNEPLTASFREDKHELAKRIERLGRYRKMKKYPKMLSAALCAVMCLASTLSVQAASVRMAEAYMWVYKATETATEETLVELPELQEYTKTDWEEGVIVEEGELLETRGIAKQFSWTLAKSSAKHSPTFVANAGQSITINVTTIPSNKRVQVGIVEPGGNKRYVQGSGAVYHTFAVTRYGAYQIYVQNLEGEEIVVWGGYSLQ